MTRLAIVHKERCNPGKCDNLCAKLCPINRTGAECIVIPKGEKAKIDEKLCTGCGICPKRCPFDAISIINLPEELKQDPIHAYGENGFHLYSLPTPLFGKVVGILGKNGIGKSTALKILAGVLKPNFGNNELMGANTMTDEEYSIKLIDFFKGTEAQIYFEKLKKGEVKISYKPQQVDLIPKQFAGTVRDLLKKVDEKNEVGSIAKKLDLTGFLDNDIKNISGGELQRVAIAAAVLKKANLYIFDEPTSFLDVKQRIRVSQFIKGLADEKTAVLIVEHDLIILDYMTDLLHIMYGEEDCYGVVSMPRTTRVAINAYLEGYLKEENIKFRGNKIEFMARPPNESESNDMLTEWHDLKKRLDNFELKAQSGGVFRKQVVGILGENGTGKTTFVKMLANVIKPDSGDIRQNIKVSYKPQYIDTDSEALVMQALDNASKNYELLLVKPLNLKPLMLKKINELSGGELQRVAVAHCLSQDADLYLLDEPSAYLDVEQRLIVSKVIRDFVDQKGKTALIVDHDLLFVDYFADHLIVFDGIPAKHGNVNGPFSMKQGMNLFLGDLNISMRRDVESERPRINKLDSQLDKKQKSEGNLYYV